MTIAGGAVLHTGTSLANTGSIGIGPGGTLDLQTNTTVAGLGTVGNNGELLISGTLDAAGGTLDSKPGTEWSDVVVAGDLKNATILNDGGTFTLQSASTLDAATWIGAMTLGANTFVNILDGLSVKDSVGAKSGTIDLTSGSGLYFANSATIDNATVKLGSQTGFSSFDAVAGKAVSLTLGPHATLSQQSGFTDVAGTLSLSDVLTNQGLINLTGGVLLEDFDTFNNVGTIALSNNASMALQTGTVTNAGLLTIAAGSGFYTGNQAIFGTSGSADSFVNTGTIQIAAGGTLGLAGYTALSDLGTVVNQGLLSIGLPNGNLDLGGGTLDVKPATAFSNVEVTSQGELSNGTVLQDGGTLMIDSGAILSSVTWIGQLNLAPFQQLDLFNLTVKDTPVATTGTLNAASTSTTLGFQTNQTLNNMTLLEGATGSTDTLYWLGATTVILGPNATLQQGAGTVQLQDVYSGDGFVNQGRMNLAGDAFADALGAFDNAGTLVLSRSEQFVVQNGTFGNTGSIDIGAYSVLQTGTSAFASSGLVTIETNGTLDVQSAVTVPQLGSINGGGLLDFTGSSSLLDIVGGTIDAKPNNSFANMAFSGGAGLTDGTVLADGGSLNLQDGAYLVNLTYVSALDVSASTNLFVDGLRVLDTPSATGGTIDVTAPGAALHFYNSDTLDHASLLIGSTSAPDGLDENPLAAGMTLTLGPNLTMMQTVGQVQLTGLAANNIYLNQGQMNLSGGTLTVADATFDNAGTIRLDNFETLAAQGIAFSNTGTIAGGDAGTLAASVTGTGVLQVDPAGNLVLEGSVAATQTVHFADATGILTIGTLGQFAATIGNINAGDQIIIDDTSVASTSFNASSHVLTLFNASKATVGSLQFGTSVTNGAAISVNGIVAPCFAAGTRISTTRGDVAVEELTLGDSVPVHDGGARSIVWIGQRAVDCAHHPEPEKVWPVRVAAHAFGPGLPARHLWLSPDHAILVGAVLIPVKYLINDTTIAQVPRDTVTYYHVELTEHSILLAERLPVESYLDTGDRSNFSNGDGPVTLYPDFSTRVWEAEGCAPLVITGPELAAARELVNVRSDMPAERRRSASFRRVVSPHAN